MKFHYIPCVWIGFVLLIYLIKNNKSYIWNTEMLWSLETLGAIWPKRTIQIGQRWIHSLTEKKTNHEWEILNIVHNYWQMANDTLGDLKCSVNFSDPLLVNAINPLVISCFRTACLGQHLSRTLKPEYLKARNV